MQWDYGTDGEVKSKPETHQRFQGGGISRSIKEWGVGKQVTKCDSKFGGGLQWNPEDEVTYMPRVIGRLWLLHLCVLVDFEALLTASPTSSLAIYSTTQHNK